MTGFVVTLIVLVGLPLLLNAGSRISRLEHRLRLVEEELRRRIAAGQELPREATTPVAAVTPAAASPVEPEPQAAPVEPAAQWVPDAPLPMEPEVPDAVVPSFASAISAAPENPTGLQSESQSEPYERSADFEPALHTQREPHRASFNFEDLFGRKLPIWAGGITLAIAGVLIVKYAIDAGFFHQVFTPGVQAVCGVLFGLGLIGGAEWAHHARQKVQDPRVSQALSGAGISTLYAALLVAANVYSLISPLAAFVGLATVTAGALWLSLRHGMPSALLGLAGGLAAPALTVGMDASVPMLATYLAFTIAGLVGVSRFQRWPWLALMALAGGAGWSLWLVLAGEALAMLGALSVGTFVLLLAIALPLFAFEGAAAGLFRIICAIVGAAQLALLVAIGGYQPLHWGLFALIAAAGQWLAWRDRTLDIVPTLGAALSVLLLLLWPDPTGYWLAATGLSLAAIHAFPLLAKLWRDPACVRSAVELSGIAAAAPLVVLRHFHAPWGEIQTPGAFAAAGGALLVLAGAARGWKVPDRTGDVRFALLLATGGALLSLAAWMGFPHWQAPLWIGIVSAALLMIARPSADPRVEPVAVFYTGLALFSLLGTIFAGRVGEVLVLFGAAAPTNGWTAILRWGGLSLLFALFAWRGERTATRLPSYFWSTALAYGLAAQLVPQWALPLAMAILAAFALEALRRRETPAAEVQILLFAAGAVLLLGVTGPHPHGEWQNLSGAGDGRASALALLRWAGVAAMGALLAVRSRLAPQRDIAQGAAALLVYGAMAQVVPPIALPLVPAAGLAGIAFWSHRIAWPRLRTACIVLTCVSAAWAFIPLVEWTYRGILSLAGVPMALDVPELTVLAVLRRLLLPALLMGSALGSLRGRLSRQAWLWSVGLVSVTGMIAAHCIYRIGFAAVFGTDFVATGLGERLLWSGLLVTAGAVLWKRGGAALSSSVAPMLVIVAAWHVAWYSLLLHNPLWTAQAAGGFPVANLLLPLFAALPACLVFIARVRPDWAGAMDRMVQPVLMATVAMFGWASLRHVFHGTLLTVPGVTPLEDILRSILGIALAVGYLLWGIRTERHSWRIASLVLMLLAVAKVFLFDAAGLSGLLRIASFVALGFSLIGIGWLYSRQLRREGH